MSEESSVIDQLKNIFTARPDAPDHAKRAKYLAILGILGLCLLLYGSLKSGEETSQSPGSTTGSVSGVLGGDRSETGSLDPAFGYRYVLERDLEVILSRVEGAGKVSVMIRLSNSPSSVYSVDRTDQTRITTESGSAQGGRKVEEVNSTEKIVTVRDDAGRREIPVLVSQELPEVQGALIVAEGASDPEVEYRLLKAAETLLGLSAHRIVILPGR